jgi:hypothetical protein
MINSRGYIQVIIYEGAESVGDIVLDLDLSPSQPNSPFILGLSRPFFFFGPQQIHFSQTQGREGLSKRVVN